MPNSYLNGEIPEEIAMQWRDEFFQDRLDNPESKRRSVQKTYKDKKYTIEKDNRMSLGVRFRHSSERTAKTNRRRKKLSKPKLSSVEKMMMDNIYEDASKRNLDVDHKISAADKGMHHPYNVGLMQPKENGRKGGRSDYHNFKYESLEEPKKNGNGHTNGNGNGNGNGHSNGDKTTLKIAGGIAKLRLARALAPGPLSLGLAAATFGQSAQAAVQNPTAATIEDVSWDTANLAADLIGLIPTPFTVGASEAMQKGLSIGHTARLAQRNFHNFNK